MVYMILIILLLTAVLFLAFKTINFYNNGILVKTQRVTGPELFVLDGEEIIKRSVTKENVTTSELFIYQYNDENWYRRPKQNIILGEVIDYRKMSITEVFPVFKIKSSISKIDYEIMKYSLIILTILLIFFTTRR